MALAKLTNMCSNLNLDQGVIYKCKYYKQHSAAELSYKYYYKHMNKSLKIGYICPDLINFEQLYEVQRGHGHGQAHQHV